MSKRHEDINTVDEFLNAIKDDATFFASLLDDMVAEYEKKSKEDGPAIKIASDE